MEAKLETIIYKEFKVNKWIADDGFCCYEASSISKAANISNERMVIRNYTIGDEIVNNEDRCKYNIITYQQCRKYARKNNKMVLLTEKGLKRLLCNSRSIESLEFAKFLGIDVYSYKPMIKETEYINAIIKSFPTEKVILQYTPINTNYRIDLYFPEYNIAVECDENHHLNNEINDQTRQKTITNELGCRWVRFQPDSPNFDIFKTIGDIYKLMH